MNWPNPTRADHQKFCVAEGWTRIRDARGQTGTHHITYELILADGRILRTRVSHPADRTDYGKAMWAHILRDQLCIDQATFWACVRDGQLPDRGQPPRPAESLPAGLVHILIDNVGLAETEIVALTRDEAIARVNQFWTEGK